MQAKNGAKLYNKYPKANETVSWKGGTDEKGFAHGPGTALWQYEGEKYELWSGYMKHGKTSDSMRLIKSGVGNPYPKKTTKKKRYVAKKKKKAKKYYSKTSSGSQRCIGITTKGARCKKMVIGGNRCHYHD